MAGKGPSSIWESYFLICDPHAQKTLRKLDNVYDFLYKSPNTLIIWKWDFYCEVIFLFKILWLMSHENSTCRILVKRIGGHGSLLSTLSQIIFFPKDTIFLLKLRNNHCTTHHLYFYLTVYIMWYISKKESNYIYVHKIAHLGKVWTDTYMNRGPGGEEGIFFCFF